MARPLKYSPEIEERIVDALRQGCSRRDAYEYGGIDERTFRRWLVRYAGFAGLVLAAESEAAFLHTRNITDAARSGDWKASLEWLKRRRRDEWGDNIEVRADAEIERLIAALLAPDAGEDPPDAATGGEPPAE